MPAVPLAASALEVAVSVAADVLVIVGIVVITLGVVGAYRLPDVYTQLHATGKAVFLGVIAFLVASLASGDGAIAARAALIAGFLILTTPVGAHVIARAAYIRGEAMRTPGALDESGVGLDRLDADPVDEEPPDPGAPPPPAGTGSDHGQPAS